MRHGDVESRDKALAVKQRRNDCGLHLFRRQDFLNACVQQRGRRIRHDKRLSGRVQRGFGAFVQGEENAICAEQPRQTASGLALDQVRVQCLQRNLDNPADQPLTGQQPLHFLLGPLALGDVGKDDQPAENPPAFIADQRAVRLHKNARPVKMLHYNVHMNDARLAG